jgi:hypothetical protein
MKQESLVWLIEIAPNQIAQDPSLGYASAASFLL